MIMIGTSSDFIEYVLVKYNHCCLFYCGATFGGKINLRICSQIAHCVFYSHPGRHSPGIFIPLRSATPEVRLSHSWGLEIKFCEVYPSGRIMVVWVEQTVEIQ
jgi:hypothetical protein